MNTTQQGPDLHQTSWCVQYRYVGNPSADRVLFRREWAARRYAKRITEGRHTYAFVYVQKRPVGVWQTVDAVVEGPIKPPDWDGALARWERNMEA